MLRKCKTLSRQLVGTSSSANRRSKSSTAVERQADAGGIMWKDISVDNYGGGEQLQETVFVGSTRKRYVIDSKYLSHPLVNALIGKSTGGDGVSVVNCEVVLFDHLLWMVENSDLNLSSDSWAELADLYCVD
ncbi:hypothetical protein L1987_02503 [Smallanthus sonchifolius]|uniref:Uncharacterized protein n=1 Tax=Smallanthus sonchifolius TaxID=185202 RepID=A0ACB9K816_9ASTR|nr:hypothetical protein L1987_02503 [Smallanthus sonchifolius]